MTSKLKAQKRASFGERYNLATQFLKEKVHGYKPHKISVNKRSCPILVPMGAKSFTFNTTLVHDPVEQLAAGIVLSCLAYLSMIVGEFRDENLAPKAEANIKTLLGYCRNSESAFRITLLLVFWIANERFNFDLRKEYAPDYSL